MNDSSDKQRTVDRGAEQLKRISKMRNKGRKGLGFQPKQAEDSKAYDINKKRDFKAKVEKISKADTSRQVQEAPQDKDPLFPQNSPERPEEVLLSRFADLKKKKLRKYE